MAVPSGLGRMLATLEPEAETRRGRRESLGTKNKAGAGTGAHTRVCKGADPSTRTGRGPAEQVEREWTGASQASARGQGGEGSQTREAVALEGEGSTSL